MPFFYITFSSSFILSTSPYNFFIYSLNAEISSECSARNNSISSSCNCWTCLLISFLNCTLLAWMIGVIYLSIKISLLIANLLLICNFNKFLMYSMCCVSYLLRYRLLRGCCTVIVGLSSSISLLTSSYLWNCEFTFCFIYSDFFLSAIFLLF